MTGPEQKNHVSEAQQNAEALEKLKQALGQQPTQEALTNQLISGGKNGERLGVVARAQEQYGTPGMSTRGPQFDRVSYENKNQPKPTSQQDAMKNTQDSVERGTAKVGDILHTIKTTPSSIHLQKPALINALTTLPPSQQVQIDGKMAHNLGIKIPGLHPNLPNKSVNISAMELNKALKGQ